VGGGGGGGGCGVFGCGGGGGGGDAKRLVGLPSSSSSCILDSSRAGLTVAGVAAAATAGWDGCCGCGVTD
jgi:hypothetical protein